MKTIGKKIKAIYFLAVVAIVSMCMAILPMMPTSVKADTQENIKVVGAQVIVIDETTSQQNYDGKYAVSFQAEFTKDFYESINIKDNVVKFGMLIGPVANYSAITSIDDAVANGFVDSCYLGNKDCEQYVTFKTGEKTCTYEGTIEYDEAVITEGLEDAEKLNALLAQSSQELAAIPYYIINGDVTLVKVDSPVVRSARKLINEAYASSNLEFGNYLFARYVGSFDNDYSGCEYYVEKTTGKVFKADANNELVPFYAVDFLSGGQLVVDGKDVEATNLSQLTFDASLMATLDEGVDYSIASFLDDEDMTVRTIKAKVVTKIISTINDFFNDVDGDGVGDVASANYIFALEAVKNTYDGNYTTPTAITGYYVLGANIDLQDNTNLVAARGDVRLLLNSLKSGFMGTLDGRGFALSNIAVGNSSSGFLGLLNGATIKNIAFDGFVTNRNDSTPCFFAYNTFNTTFENVYIRAKAYTPVYGDNYVSMAKVFGGLSDKYGKNVFTNVIYENTDALLEGFDKKYDRATFSNDVTSDYTNTTVIGLPSHFSQAAHEVDTEKRVLTLYISSAAMTAFGVTAGEIALADCPEAVITAYAGLIANLESKFTIDIEYINFAEDTVRNYYVDNSALVADTAVANAYLETGLWAMANGSLVWNSLVVDSYYVVSTNDDPTDMAFKDSITLEMFKGNEKIEDIRLRVRQEDLVYVTVSGTTLTRIPTAPLIKTRDFVIDVIYTVGAKSYEVAVPMTLEFNYDIVDVYQSGEFIIETSTGKVYMPNANNELELFDATGYLAGVDKLYFAGVEIDVVSANPFVIDVTALEGVKYGVKQPIAAFYGDSARYLVASMATNVLFSAKDFFVDADGSGEVEAEEMIQANYIFYLGTDNASGLIFPQKTITGYYVLANNIDLAGVAIGNGDTGERHYTIYNAAEYNLGFNGTFDGRGFALQNGNPARGTGMFGMFYDATIKNIAFDGFTNSIGNSNALILGRAYNSTFENVYIRVIGNNGNDGHAGANNTFTTIASADSLGVSTFNNVVFEAMDGLTAGNTNAHQRFTLIGNATLGSFTNTSVIGMPVTFAYAKHATDTEKAVLSLTLPADAIAAFGLEAGEYAIADCSAVVTAYAGLIANFNAKYSSEIGYINLVEDTQARNYYANASAFSNDASVVATYLDTGLWVKLGDVIAWKSLVNSEYFTVKSNNDDSSNMMFEDSITLEMFYGNNQLDNVTITSAQEYADIITIDGMTISKKEGIILIKDEIVPVTLTYSDGVNEYSKTIELTVKVDLSQIEDFEAGEFILDKTTGKLFKENANNELVPYDATAFTAGMTEMYVAGAQATVTDTTVFTLQSTALETLPTMEDLAITVVYNNGDEVAARCLKVKAVTRVLATLSDFFVDADGSGEVEAEEMIQANYIFNLQVTQSSGAKLPSVGIYGYYVLANNIDLQGKSGLTASTGDQSVQIWNASAGTGFRATLDGRGFALRNINLGTGGSGGMFGSLYGATFKDIAFDGFQTQRNDGGVYLIGTVYCSTFENVYIRAVGNNTADSYNSVGNGVVAVALMDTDSKITNLIFENTDGLVSGATNKHQRVTFVGASGTRGTYENVSLIGMPIDFAVSSNLLTITVSSAMLAKLGVEETEYAIADCPANAYSDLIANVAAKTTTVTTVKFVVDTTVRADYISNAELAASNAANAYVETGFWTKLGDVIAWKSLVDGEYFAVKSNNADPENLMFRESIELAMYYGSTKLESAEITSADETLVTINGTTITKRADVVLIKDEIISVTLSYSDGANTYTKTVEVTLQADLDSIENFEGGEFILDKTTGKLFKANKNNELVAYDATAFAANMTETYVAGAKATVKNTTEFTVDSDVIETLPINEEIAITVIYNDGSEAGARALKVKAVTRVLATLSDFFVDADASGVVEDTEMTRDNYIFNVKAVAGSGAAIPSIAITGYYVLANNIDLKNNNSLNNKSSGSSEQTIQIWASSGEVGFMGTLDGRGFALKNGTISGTSAGMFGAFYKATVKNIAFDGFTNNAGNSQGLILGYAYYSTFENVYIRAVGNAYGDNYSGENAWKAINVSDALGTSTFTNIVFENTDAFKEGAKNAHFRFVFTGTPSAGIYNNVNLVGMPVKATYSTHATDTEKYMLDVTLPTSALAALGLEAKVYALEECSIADEYANLIANIESRRSIDIAYINVIEDTKEGLGYSYDKAGLALSTSASIYTETGCWKKLGNELAWATLVDESNITVQTSIEDGKFVDSIAVNMYYGESVVDAVLSVSDEDAKFVEISGNTITRKANAQVLVDEPITVTVAYAGITKTVELTLLFDFDSVVTYEDGEFVIEATTGKVFKTNENNELVVYDATSYLGENQTVVINDVEQTVTAKTPFTLATAGLEAIALNEKFIIFAGENCLVAKAVTKVISTYADFFVDADASGTIEEEEMIQANYIFNLKVTQSSGAKLPSIAVKGVYVLANSIDLQGKGGALTASTGDQSVQIWNASADTGFRATLDGRGFALKNINLGTGGSGGMFGAMYAATIKNIAFDGITSQRNDGGIYLLGTVYSSTFENVYIRAVGNNANDSYNSGSNSVVTVALMDTGSKLTNVIFENTDGLVAGATNKHQRISFVGATGTRGTYENVSLIGMPIDFAVASGVLTITVSSAMLAKLGVEAIEYAIADCPTNAYSDLIANVAAKTTTVTTVKFAVDTTTRADYINSAALVADTTTVGAFVATGYWKVVDNALVWAK